MFLRGISIPLISYSVWYCATFWPLHTERREAGCCSVGVYQLCIQPTSIFSCLTWTAMTCRELVCVQPGCFCGSPAGGSRWMVWAVSGMAVRVLSVLLYGVWCIRDDSVLFFHVANSQPYTLTIRDIGIFFFCLLGYCAWPGAQWMSFIWQVRLNNTLF